MADSAALGAREPGGGTAGTAGLDGWTRVKRGTAILHEARLLRTGMAQELVVMMSRGSGQRA